VEIFNNQNLTLEDGDEVTFTEVEGMKLIEGET